MTSISLKPDLDELYRLNEFISGNLGEEDLHVSLIAEEVFVNIVNYSEAQSITVDVNFENPVLTMVFIDDGFEFNPLIKEDPTAPESIEEAQIGGLGIFLTKEMADELEYEYVDGENRFTITKKVE